MSDLGIRDIAYRLFRLRRLIGVAAVLPLPALGLALLSQVPVGGWMALVWLGFVLLHALRFPNAWLELIALALTLAILFVAAPIGGRFGIHWLLGYPLALALGAVLWLVLSSALHGFERLPWPFEVAPLRKHLRISPEAARAALFLRPNAQIGTYRCGPADKDGNFEVTVGPPEPAPGFRLSDLEFGGFDLPAAEPDAGFSFLAKLVHDDALSQEVLAVHKPGSDAQEVQTLIQTLEPAKGGTAYEKVETGEVMGGLSGLGFWLTDADADELSATLDQAAGRRSRALRDATQEPLQGRIGQWLRQRLAARRLRRSSAA